MEHTVKFVRKWNSAVDCIAHDQRGNKKQRAIYRHEWKTGNQLLVFDTPEAAKKFEAAVNAFEQDKQTDADRFALGEARLALHIAM